MAKLIWVATLTAILAFVVFAAAATATATTDSSPSPSPSPSPSSKCFAGIYDMMDCLDYVIKGSKTTSPGKGCCKGIEKVIGKSPDCLCVALVEARSLGVSLNMTRILGLPKACSLKTPPLNNCSAPSMPSPVPAPAPTILPAQSPATTEAPAPAPSIAIKLMTNLAVLISMAFAIVVNLVA